MTDKFWAGDRVRLTDRAATVATRGFVHHGRRHRVDWHQRRGTVAHTTTPGGGNVLIVWDDCKTKDSWPKSAVELDEAQQGWEHGQSDALRAALDKDVS